MARVKLTEYDTKRLVFPALKVFQATTSTRSQEIIDFFGSIPLVVKVDQGIKKRGKQGLVAVNLSPPEIIGKIREWSDLQFTNFLVEPVVAHAPSAENFLSLLRTRYGWNTLYSPQGGIDIEANWDSVTSRVPRSLQAKISTLLLPNLDKLHLASLELNPFLINDHGALIPLDAAAEIDDASLGLAELAQYNLRAVADRASHPSELAIAKLDASTPASLKFKLINPQGRIWMLLSGGGASLVLADEVADLGLGGELANYGEYSGAPTADDTYTYTKIIIAQLLKSKIKNQKSLALIIAGGVANFTDVEKTFRGLIRALEEKKSLLLKAKVKVFVRRGGPNEKKGLTIMRNFLAGSQLLGSVYGHDIALTQVIQDVKGYLS